MKKLFCGLLSGIIMLGSASVIMAEERFVDFSKDNYAWAYDEVIDMADKGYINGYEDGTFKPDNEVTRLEVLALFARALGVYAPDNKPILNVAAEQYADVIKSYELPWGETEIAFLLYRNVLTVADLDTYLKADLKAQAMPRHEAAVIITKAMGGKVSEDTEVANIDYVDYNKIPLSSIRYVEFVTDNEIMNGMEDGKFSPETSVLRTQIALILSRVLKKADYKFITGKLENIDIDGRMLALYDENAEIQKYTYNSNVVMKIKGEEKTPEDMITNVDVIITLINDKVAFVDTLASVPDKTISGTFKNYDKESGYIKIIVEDSEETYRCGFDAVVIYDGQPADVSYLVAEDDVVLETKDDVVVKITGKSDTFTIKGATLKSVNIEEEFSMTIAHATEEYNGATYPISDEVTVVRNDVAAEFASLLDGDNVELKISDGEIISITATSTTTVKTGTIREIIVAANPRLVINVGGEVESLSVIPGVEVVIDGKEAALYDFRVGDSVSVTLESNVVVKISEAAAPSTNSKLDGKVTAVNTVLGFVRISYVNEYGVTVEEPVYCKDSTTKIMDFTGAEMKLKDIEEGSSITTHGSINNGVFYANIIVVSAE